MKCPEWARESGADFGKRAEISSGWLMPDCIFVSGSVLSIADIYVIYALFIKLLYIVDI
jgi:hypothetical protein